jgi:hypothetical protein
VTAAQDTAAVLAGLSSARTPWLTLALAGPTVYGRLATAAAGAVTVVDITDPQAAPVMVNPLEPAPGYPVQAHTDRLAGLFEASFGLGEPIAGALRAGLRRAYADCGWDMRTGAGRPGTVSSPAIPVFRQLKLATEDAARAPALRTCYDPRYLAAVTATVAGRGLADGDAGLARAGSVWVIPQLRWLHEMERLTPFGRDRLRPGDIAPPLDFGLAGLPDWPGIRVADRLDGLRGHPLAMGSERNRRIAVTALLGNERADLDADLAITGMGVSPPLRLRHAARMMGAAGHGGQPGWLEVVLSWPGRFTGPAAGIPAAPAAPARDVHGTATG